MQIVLPFGNVKLCEKLSYVAASCLIFSSNLLQETKKSKHISRNLELSFKYTRHDWSGALDELCRKHSMPCERGSWLPKGAHIG